jgi:hypothetical protein
MQTPSLAAYVQPGIYSEAAVDAARTAPLDALSVDMSHIRFWLALSEDDVATAKVCFERLRSEKLGGWPLYQVTTGGIFLAIKQGDETAIIAAIDAWLTGLAAYPGNWQTGLLQAPEVVPWLGHFDPERFASLPSRKRRLTAKQRAFVRDVAGALGQALTENLSWLRELGFHEEPETIASWYELSSVSLTLREATFDASNDAPSLIVALDGDGNFTGSFIAH